MKEAFLLQSEPFLKNKIFDSHAVSLSIVVPLFNETESITLLMESIFQSMSAYKNRWELILVDDGSVDDTSKKIHQLITLNQFSTLYGHVHLLELSRNYGQTAAMQAGIDFAKGEFIVTMDGDLQNDPDDILHILEHLIKHDLDLVVGWRKERKDNVIARKIPSWLANKLIAKVSGVQLHDYGCSLKAYRGDVIRKVKLMGEMHRFIPLWVAGIVPINRIAEIPVKHHARKFGTSKYGISRSVRVFLDLLAVMFFRRYLARPGHFFGAIGLFIGFLGGAILSWLFVEKFIFGQNIGTRPLLLVGVVSILMSLQFIMTGILAEMISRTYFNSSENRSYVIRTLYTNNSYTSTSANN